MEAYKMPIKVLKEIMKEVICVARMGCFWQFERSRGVV